jgi:hypothetical protein
MEIKTLKNAIDRLAYTTSNGNKSNETDVTALNKIIDFINNANEEVINKNQLYCKLYAIILNNYFVYYEDIEQANIILNKDLEKETYIHIYKLHMNLNSIYLDKWFKSKGIVDEWRDFNVNNFDYSKQDLTNWFNKNKEQVLDENAKNKEIFKTIDANEFLSVVEYFTIEKVYEKFNANVSLSFNSFKNQKFCSIKDNENFKSSLNKLKNIIK